MDAGCNSRDSLFSALRRCNVCGVRLRITEEMLASVRALQAKSRSGSAWHRRQLELVAAALEQLKNLPGPPVEETASLRRVVQRKRHELWRTSHPYEGGIAVRLICWFTPAGDVVVAVLNGEKSSIGDVWYESVANRADPLIDLWLQREARKEEHGGKQDNPSRGQDDGE
jgi:hypothetical protein